MVDADTNTKVGAAYVPWANGHPLVVHVHPRNDDAHFTRSFESQHIGFLGGRERRSGLAKTSNKLNTPPHKYDIHIRPFHKLLSVSFKSAFQRSALTHIANGCQLLTQVVGFEAAGGFHRVEAAVVNGELGPHEVRPATGTRLSQRHADGWNRPSDITTMAGQIV